MQNCVQASPNNCVKPPPSWNLLQPLTMLDLSAEASAYACLEKSPGMSAKLKAMILGRWVQGNEEVLYIKVQTLCGCRENAVKPFQYYVYRYV